LERREESKKKEKVSGREDKRKEVWEGGKMEGWKEGRKEGRREGSA